MFLLPDLQRNDREYNTQNGYDPKPRHDLRFMVTQLLVMVM